METAAVYQELQTVFQDVFDDEAVVLRPELSAADVEDWDSVSHIRLMLTVERKFGVKFSASEIGKLKNVDDLVRLIQSKTSSS